MRIKYKVESSHLNHFGNLKNSEYNTYNTNIFNIPNSAKNSKYYLILQIVLQRNRSRRTGYINLRQSIAIKSHVGIQIDKLQTARNTQTKQLERLKTRNEIARKSGRGSKAALERARLVDERKGPRETDGEAVAVRAALVERVRVILRKVVVVWRQRRVQDVRFDEAVAAFVREDLICARELLVVGRWCWRRVDVYSARL